MAMSNSKLLKMLSHAQMTKIVRSLTIEILKLKFLLKEPSEKKVLIKLPKIISMLKTFLSKKLKTRKKTKKIPKSFKKKQRKNSLLSEWKAIKKERLSVQRYCFISWMKQKNLLLLSVTKILKMLKKLQNNLMKSLLMITLKNYYLLVLLNRKPIEKLSFVSNLKTKWSSSKILKLKSLKSKSKKYQQIMANVKSFHLRNNVVLAPAEKLLSKNTDGLNTLQIYMQKKPFLSEILTTKLDNFSMKIKS